MERPNQNRKVGKSFTIRTRLLVSFIIIVLLPATAITAVSVSNGIATAEQQVVEQLQSVTVLKEAEIQTWLENLQLDLTTELDREGFTDRATTLLLFPVDADGFQGAYDEQQQIFNESIRLRQRFEELFLIDLEGLVVLSTDASQEGQPLVNRTYFQSGLRGPFVSAPFYSVALGAPTVISVQPVTDAQGEVVGVLAGRSSITTLNKIMNERAGLGETGETYLVADNYASVTTLRFTDADISIYTEGTNQAIGEQLNGSGVYDSYFANQSVIGVYRWLPDLHVALLAEQRRSEAFTQIYQTTAINIGVALFFIMSAIVASLFITRSIVGPLSQLATTAAQVSAGDLSHTIEIQRTDEIGQVAEAFNSMTVQLRSLIGGLEQRVEERTRALELSSRVSRRLSTILNEKQLAVEVVEQVQKAFDYYYTQIYLFDGGQQNLVLVAGTGEIGDKMLAKGHQLAPGQGLVGQAAAGNTIRLVTDVSQEKNWLANPLLPDTKAEVAVPIAGGNIVLGILDVQHNLVNGLSHVDADLLQSIANQVAIAIQNARAFERVNRQAAELETVARVSAAVSSLLELNKLLQEVVELTQANFNFYQVHIFLLNEERDRLIMAAGTGESGRQMVAERLYIPLTQEHSLVVQAVLTRQPVIVNDTNAAPDYLAHPLLPDTRSEVTFPLQVHGRILGVLDAQGAAPALFSTEEVQVLQTMAEQIAVAIQNAQLYSEAQTARQTAESASMMKTQFLANVSHELRTPMNAILNFSTFVAEGILGPVNEAQIDALNKTIDSGKHLLSLINDILDISKIEAGSMELFIEEVDMNNILAMVLSTAKGLIQDKPIELVTRIEDDLPPLRGDRRRIRQVLLNLISNAAKFTLEGQIIIRASRREREIYLAVQDSGIGISPEDQELVFESFGQAKHNLPEVGGTGLGMPISKHFVEAHGGRIWLDSTAGVGTTFHLVLPFITQDDDEALQSSPSSLDRV